MCSISKCQSRRKRKYGKYIHNKELVKQNKESDKQKARNDKTEKF